MSVFSSANQTNESKVHSSQYLTAMDDGDKAGSGSADPAAPTEPKAK